MDGKKDKKSERTGTVRKAKTILQKYYKYYKNISKIFQNVWTFVAKCNIYRLRKKHRNNLEELSWQ